MVAHAFELRHPACDRDRGNRAANDDGPVRRRRQRALRIPTISSPRGAMFALGRALYTRARRLRRLRLRNGPKRAIDSGSSCDRGNLRCADGDSARCRGDRDVAFRSRARSRRANRRPWRGRFAHSGRAALGVDHADAAVAGATQFAGAAPLRRRCAARRRGITLCARRRCTRGIAPCNRSIRRRRRAVHRGYRAERVAAANPRCAARPAGPTLCFRLPARSSPRATAGRSCIRA